MDDARGADLEALARAVEHDATELGAWARAAGRRRHVIARRARAAVRRATLGREHDAWQDAREQAEVDREARCSARRMAHVAALHPKPPERVDPGDDRGTLGG